MGHNGLSNEKLVLNTLKSANKPLRARQIAEITGLDCKVVFNSFYKLKESGEIVFCSQCMWEPADK